MTSPEKLVFKYNDKLIVLNLNILVTQRFKNLNKGMRCK